MAKTIGQLKQVHSVTGNLKVPLEDENGYTYYGTTTQLVGDLTHNHDLRYYTKTEMDASLSGKADTSHNHDDRYYTETETDALLADKAASSHSHSDATTGASGFMSATDKTKLDGIESNATADQTGAEIKTAYEGEADTNAFTDALLTKLNGIEAGATAGGTMTGAEIKTAYEGEADTNAFTDALQTKLNGIESNATADQTGAEIKTAYEGEADTNAFTDALLTKLNGIESNATADMTGAEIKTAYEGQSNTNAFTDTLLTKLNGIESNATADQSNSEIETAYNAQVSQVSTAERTAGTATAIRRFAPADIKSMIDTHGGAGGILYEHVSTTTLDGSSSLTPEITVDLTGYDEFVVFWYGIYPTTNNGSARYPCVQFSTNGGSSWSGKARVGYSSVYSQTHYTQMVIRPSRTNGNHGWVMFWQDNGQTSYPYNTRSERGNNYIDYGSGPQSVDKLRFTFNDANLRGSTESNYETARLTILMRKWDMS